MYSFQIWYWLYPILGAASIKYERLSKLTSLSPKFLFISRDIENFLNPIAVIKFPSQYKVWSVELTWKTLARRFQYCGSEWLPKPIARESPIAWPLMLTSERVRLASNIKTSGIKSFFSWYLVSKRSPRRHYFTYESLRIPAICRHSIGHFSGPSLEINCISFSIAMRLSTWFM